MTTILTPQHLAATGLAPQHEDEFGRARRGRFRPVRPPRPKRRRRTYVQNIIWGDNACPCVYGGGDSARRDAPDGAYDDAPPPTPDGAEEHPQDEIVARTSDELYEMLEEVQRTFHAQVAWSQPIPLANASQLPSTPGVYMVLRAGRPLYVGQSSNVQRRWLGRLETLTQLAIDPSPYKVRVGTINKTGTETRSAGSASVRRDVEAALITTSPVKLTNRSSIKPFTVGKKGATLTQVGPRGGMRTRQGVVGKSFREW
ncbi:hypothetical protein [Gemmatimonas groenlandica]|uniref:GIY-YIG domain-containing protein n=1 Tax=Gemmatimonas groenlandica TaxID=2732249 RepID=A0A6M4INU1_9BACT|nr:hypothetical protein [Gemmatimonas groenlandica]QJR35695.1 hypothetical protein HKW67_09310 [Gemmatimonas groenlandica]